MSKKQYSTKQRLAFKQKAKAKSDAIVKDVAENIVGMIASEKTEEWQREWQLNPAYGLPHNPVTGNKYSGLNQLLLMIDMMLSKRIDARYCTFKQAQKLGENTFVNKPGAITLLRPIFIDKKEDLIKDDGSEASEEDKILVSYRFFNVHSAEDIENVPAAEDFFEPLSWADNDIIEHLLESSGVQLVHGTNQAHYNLTQNIIAMPSKTAFDNAAKYYGILLHEWYHSTGHKEREDRLGEKSTLEERSLEELRAEIFSIMAAKALGLPYNTETSADYINIWNKRCKDNPKEIIAQANKASKVLQDVLLFIQGQQPSAKWFPNKSTWPTREVFQEINLEDDFETTVSDFIKKYDTRFKNSKGEHDGEFVWEIGNNNDSDFPEQIDIKEGFRIKGELEDQFGDMVTVDVEAQAGFVLVTAIFEGLNDDQYHNSALSL